MTDITLTAVVGMTALVSAAGGSFATIYTRGRTDGRRDERIDGHERRIEAMRERVQKLEAGQASADTCIARLEEKVDSLKDTAEDTKRLVLQLVTGHKK